MRSIVLLPGSLLQKLLDSHVVSWASAKWWRMTIILASTAFFFAFPSYDVALVLHEFDSDWEAIFTQASHPFTDHNALYHPDSHSAKLAFRFVPALILRALRIDTMAGAMVLQAVLGVIFYALLHQGLKELTAGSGRKALAFALPFCFIFTGHVYASDYRGIFDVLALDLLLAALLVRRTIWVIPAILLASFTDERALLATPALVLLHLYQADPAAKLSGILKSMLTRPVTLVIVAWVCYFSLRYMLGNYFGLYTPHIDLSAYIEYNLPRLGYALYIGLEGFFLVAGLVITILAQRKAYWFLAGLIGAYGILFFCSICVIDINRSQTYLVLWLFLLLFIMDRESHPAVAQSLLGLVLLVSVCYDDVFPFPLQLARMAFVSKTLLPLEGWDIH